MMAISAAAQEVDSTVVAAEKLNFEQPRFLVSDYFSSVKAHLSKEGRKEWRPEFTLRANAEFLDGSLNLIGGIRTSQNKVFGLGAGWGQRFFILGPESGNPWGHRISLFLYHRHYLPLGHKKIVSFYSDIMLGGYVVYKMCDWYNGYVSGPDKEPEYPVYPGYMQWWISWQPGIAFSMWGKSNFFIGLSIGPTIGMHAGITI